MALKSHKTSEFIQNFRFDARFEFPSYFLIARYFLTPGLNFQV